MAVDAIEMLFNLVLSFHSNRSHVKAQENERLRLMSIKDAFEKKENETNKLLSELRVQVIELREANVSPINA